MERRSGIRLDAAAGVPYYQQIFDQVASRIRSGAFPPDHRLPPTRALAVELGTHRNTVVRAYELLEEAGLVASSLGSGTYVLEQEPASIPEPARGAGLRWDVLLRDRARDPVTRFDELGTAYGRSDVINLARMQPSPALLPLDPLRRCFDHVLRTVGRRALAYGAREGLPQLRELIAIELGRQGVPAHADHVVVTSGSQQGLDLIARALVTPGDVVLTEPLTYPGALGAFSVAGARIVSVPTDAEGPMPSALRALARELRPKALYLMPNCHNPTGATMPNARREAIVAFSHEHGVALVEDDYGFDVNLAGEPVPPSLRALDADVLYVGSFSKKLAPSLRIGFVVCPKPVRDTLLALKHGVDIGSSALVQHALAEFIDRGHLRPHLERVVGEYRARRDLLLRALGAFAPARPPENGMLVWLPLASPARMTAVCEAARASGVLVSSGMLYEVEPGTAAGIRVALCAETKARLAEGARRLVRALETQG